MASITKRTWTNDDGSNSAAFVVSYKDQHGKRHRKQFSKKKDADAWLVKARAEVAQGIHTPDSTALTISEAAELWLRACSLGRDGREPVEPHTWRVYGSHVRLHIDPLIGDQRVGRLTAPDVANFRDALLSKLSRVSAKKVLSSLYAILATCHTRGLVAQNVAIGISISDSGRRKAKIEIPSKANVKAILETAQTWSMSNQAHVAKAWRRYHALLMTAALTGMRASELRGLRKLDLDLSGTLIRVRQRADEKGIIGHLKSDAGERDIPIAKELASVLRRWLVECPPSDLVFPNWTGNVESHGNITNRCWKPILKRAGITQSFKFHTLRHFHASMLIATDATPKEVMSEMGHASIQMTFDTYGHLFPEDDAARKVRAEAMAADILRSNKKTSAFSCIAESLEAI